MTSLSRLATIALPLIAVPACEPAPISEASAPGDLEIEFRDDYKTTGEKGNTCNLGEGDDLPFNHLPLGSPTVDGFTISEIRAYHCLDDAAGEIEGEFSTNGVSVSLSVSEDGTLQPITVYDIADPSHTCTLSGDLWAGTSWEITVDDGITTVQTDLWLNDVSVDEHNRSVYEWYVNYWRIDPSAPRPQYRPTCDEDPDDGADPALRYHAYFVPGLQLNETSGDLTLDANPVSAFVACRSGAVGKAMAWGYTSSTFDVETHELATRMVRADYCGDGFSHTVSGTPIWVESEIVAADALAPDDQLYGVEAVWDLDLGHASCVTLPRIEQYQGFDPEFTCPDEVTTLPVCGPQHFNGTGAIMTTHTPL